MAQTKLYIGLMSGTSMDAVDSVLIQVGAESLEVLAHHSTPIDEELKSDIHRLSHPGQDNVHLLGKTDVTIGKLFARTALSLIEKQNLEPGQISAIGSHGQTIRHHPPSIASEEAYTVQIGDPNTIAATTGIPTVADFRRKDIALGGEAAPLVPGFHQAIFQSSSQNRAVINIGGIANITWLPAQSSGQPIRGFDCGPGNCLMDAWIRRHENRDFDAAGGWASSGDINDQLLEILMTEPYLALEPPKSTGKELFNLAWLDNHLSALPYALPAESVQATLCEYTARTIAEGLKLVIKEDGLDGIYICGGGAFNLHLLTRLQYHAAPVPVSITEATGIHPLHVEAAAFAWFAHRTLNQLTASVPSVTGASRAAILGGIYLP